MAPGTYINTTHTGSLYNITSGTSYAAPHVSGAAALLLQKNPKLDRHELKSIIMTTADTVSDAYGTRLSIHDTGSGRLNITRAYEADVAILPPSFVVMMSERTPVAEKRFEIRSVVENNTGIVDDVFFSGPDFIEFTHLFDDDFVFVKMRILPNATSVINQTVNADDSPYGDAPYGMYEGHLTFVFDGSDYTVPFLLHYTRASVNTTVTFENDNNNVQNDNVTAGDVSRHLTFDISHPDGWEFAKLMVIDSVTEESVTVTATLDNMVDEAAVLKVQKNSTYWVDAQITSGGKLYRAYDVIDVGDNVDSPETFDALWLKHRSEQQNAFEMSETLPMRQIAMVIGVVFVIGVVGVVLKFRN